MAAPRKTAAPADSDGVSHGGSEPLMMDTLCEMRRNVGGTPLRQGGPARWDDTTEEGAQLATALEEVVITVYLMAIHVRDDQLMGQILHTLACGTAPTSRAGPPAAANEVEGLAISSSESRLVAALELVGAYAYRGSVVGNIKYMGRFDGRVLRETYDLWLYPTSAAGVCALIRAWGVLCETLGIPPLDRYVELMTEPDDLEDDALCEIEITPSVMQRLFAHSRSARPSVRAAGRALCAQRRAQRGLSLSALPRRGHDEGSNDEGGSGGGSSPQPRLHGPAPSNDSGGGDGADGGACGGAGGADGDGGGGADGQGGWRAEGAPGAADPADGSMVHSSLTSTLASTSAFDSPYVRPLH